MATSTNCSGFSTIEIVISLAVVTVSLVAAAGASFSGYIFLLDSELSLQATYRIEYLAEKMIHEEYNFNTITSTSTVFDGMYAENQSVFDITPCVKKVNLRESWLREKSEQFVDVSLLLTYPLYVSYIKESCSGSQFNGEDWKTYAATEALFNISDVNILTDLDVVHSVAIISSNGATSTAFDVTLYDLEKNLYLGGIDIAQGVFAVDATYQYVFAAVNATSSQLAVVDITDLEKPHVIAQKSLDGVDPFGSFPQARSIIYFDGYVYVGTKETAGPELHVFDVHDPYDPVEIGSVEVTHNIHAMTVRDGILYAATSADTKELIVFDVSNPSEPKEIGAFNAGTSLVNDKDATSLYLLGNTVYLGRKRGTEANPELYTIDVSSSTSPTLISALHIPFVGTLSYISSVIVQGNVAFISTTDPSHGFFAVDVSDAVQPKILSEEHVSSSLAALDIEHDHIFAIEAIVEESVGRAYEITSTIKHE